MRNIVLIAHNLRSCHNVGSLLRTAEGLGVQTVLLSGYTPYPLLPEGKVDTRLPHEARKLHRQIQKTALDAETSQPWQRVEDITGTIQTLKDDGYMVAAIEQSSQSISLPSFSPPQNIALLVGREVEGIEPEVLAMTDTVLEIPMFGSKESFNVVQAAAMSLYHCRFTIDNSSFADQKQPIDT